MSRLRLARRPEVRARCGVAVGSGRWAIVDQAPAREGPGTGRRIPLYWEGPAGWLKVRRVGACAATLEGGFALYWEGTAGRLKVCPVGACALPSAPTRSFENRLSVEAFSMLAVRLRCARTSSRDRLSA